MAELAWRHPLHEFQERGIERLLASDAALLADEMGLGKTIQAIAALRILVDEGKVESVLVVVPVRSGGAGRADLAALARDRSADHPRAGVDRALEAALQRLPKI